MMTVEIRVERTEDRARIREVTERAFRGAAHTCQREHLLVDALWDAGALALSLVAVAPPGIVGHVAASPVNVPPGGGAWFGLGPISVLPECQRQGIGSRLMREALARLRAGGARGCVLVGDPQFYARFGFRSDPRLVVPGVPPAVSLSLHFIECEDRGTVRFHPAFDLCADQLATPPDAGRKPPGGAGQ